MAACANLDASNNVQINTTPIDECTGYVVYAASDWQANSFFNLPASTDFAAAWAAGFILPMTLYMVAWAAAKLVNFWR